MVPTELDAGLYPGVKFMYECVMGLRKHEGQGCILADEMYATFSKIIATLPECSFERAIGGWGKHSRYNYVYYEPRKL